MTTEDLIKNYYLTKNLECPNIYCKDCGKLIIYEGSKIGFKSKGLHKGDIYGAGFTFLSEKEFNGHTYYLSRCKECVAKKYPHIKDVKFLYAQKASYYTQYAYDVSNEDFNAYTKVRLAVTKEKMINHYGLDEGLSKWNSYRNKQAITNTFEYKQEKYGMSKEEFDEFNKSRACTKELFIQRHGEEEGLKKWNEYCERQRYTTSLEYFIEKYGDEEGNKKYNEFSNARILYNGYSKIANTFFDELISHDEFLNHECYYYNHPYEYSIKNYHVDFYDKTCNIVIEFYGDVWHANPNIYKEDEIIKILGNSIIIPKERWESDNKRKNFIMNEIHCEFIEVWESDIKHKGSKFETIKRICNIINDINLSKLNGNTIK